MEPLDEQIDPRLQVRLNSLVAVSSRDPEMAASGRANFLAQAQSLVNGTNPVQAVSPAAERRPIGWIEKINTLFGRKERSPMFATLVSIFVVASMVLGGGGAAVFAAQGSLPGEALYGVKTLGEDLRLDLASGPQAQLALELAYANRRVEEMGSLARRGEPVPEPLEARYQHQMEAAFQQCANLDDAGLLPALEQVRQRLQEQERLLQTLRAQGDPQAQAALDRVRERIRLQQQLVENGQRDPQGFRRQVQAGGPFGPQGGPSNQQGGGQGNCADCPQASGTPGAGNSYGPGPAAGTPAPGSSYGPGPAPVATHEPEEGDSHGYGPGPGDGDGTCDGCDGIAPQDGSGQQYGPGGPQNGPGDGSGEGIAPQEGSGQQYGPGDGTCDGCDGTPPQDGSGQQYGPGDQNGPGDGDGDGTCDGCGTQQPDGSGDGSHHEGGGEHGGKP